MFAPKTPKVKVIKIKGKNYKCSCKDTDDDIVDIIPGSSKLDAENQSGVEDCVHGLLVNVSYFNYPEAEKTGLKDFDNLIELAKKEKYDYLDIDRDGPEYDDLPKYEW